MELCVVLCFCGLEVIGGDFREKGASLRGGMGFGGPTIDSRGFVNVSLGAWVACMYAMAWPDLECCIPFFGEGGGVDSGERGGMDFGTEADLGVVLGVGERGGEVAGGFAARTGFAGDLGCGSFGEGISPPEFVV